jgi:hypothetical protein
MFGADSAAYEPNASVSIMPTPAELFLLIRIPC